MEGGADDGKATPAKADAPAAKADATPAAAAHEPKFDAKGFELDKNGLRKHEVGYHSDHKKEDNACLKCFKKLFTKLFPYNSVETFTGWGK